MSRGPGIIQRSILAKVHANPGISEGQLRWQLAVDHSAINDAGIRDTFYKGFQRAIGRLASKPRSPLRVHARPLADFQEVVEHFPFKTRETRLRELREIFLPRLAEILARGRLKFTSADSERYVLGRTKPSFFNRGADAAEWGEAKAEWASLDSDLLQLIPAHPAAFDVVLKGREYFGVRSPYLVDRGRPRYSGDYTLRSTIDALADERSEDASLNGALQRVETLARRWLPEDDYVSATLKAELYQLVNFSKDFAPSLHTIVKAQLYDQYTLDVAALPGHVDGSPQRRRIAPGQVLSMPEQFSPILDQLLDRHVLQDFRFYQLADAA